MTYKFIADGGHGWLRVPTKELVELGIADMVSAYSSFSPDGNYTYLEEDCDATLFIDAKDGDVKYTIQYVHIAKNIREVYPSYYSEYALTRFA